MKEKTSKRSFWGQISFEKKGEKKLASEIEPKKTFWKTKSLKKISLTREKSFFSLKGFQEKI